MRIVSVHSVSVVIPVYNGSSTIGQAVASVINQTRQPAEIIIVDDASTDNTQAVITKITAGLAVPVRTIVLTTNSGPGAARNKGISAATATWIAFLDADDTYEPCRLERMCIAADEANADFLADNLRMIDPVSGYNNRHGISRRLLSDPLSLGVEEFVSHCMTNTREAVDFGLLKPIMRRSFVSRNALYFDETIRIGEDFDFYLRALQAGARFTVIAEAYYNYTERYGSDSKTVSAVTRTTATHKDLQAVNDALVEKVRLGGDRQLTDLLKRRSRALNRLHSPTLLSSLKRRLSASSLAQDAASLGIGQLVKLAIQTIYFVLLARSLRADQFGAFVATTALVAIAAPYVGLGCPNLFIKNVRSGKRSPALCWGNGLLLIALSGLATGILLLAAQNIFKIGPDAELLLIVVVSDLLFLRVTDLAAFGFAASKRMKATAIQNVVLSLLRLLALCCLLIIRRDVDLREWSIAYLITSALGCLYALYQGWRMWGVPRLSWQAIRDDASEGVFFSIGTSAQSIYNDIDKTMLGKLSTLAAAGTYGAAYRIIDVSMTPLRSLVSASYPEFFSRGSESPLAAYRYAQRRIYQAALPSLFLGAVLFASAPLLPYIVGKSYEGIVPAIRLLAPLPFLRCFHLFYADALSGSGAQRLRTTLQLSVAAVNVLVNVIILPRWAWRGAAWSSLGCDLLLALGTWSMLSLVVGRRKQGILATGAAAQ